MGLKRNAQTGTPVRVFRGSRDSAGETQYTYEGLYAVKDARRVGDHLDASGLPLQQHSPNAAGLPSHKRALQMEQGPPMQQDNIQQGRQKRPFTCLVAICGCRKQVEFRSMSKKSGAYQPRARLAAPDENSALVAPRPSKKSKVPVIGSAEAPWGPIDRKAREVGAQSALSLIVPFLVDSWPEVAGPAESTPKGMGVGNQSFHEVFHPQPNALAVGAIRPGGTIFVPTAKVL
eukprot:142691-Pelagomonas_calceolata.AAC.7